MRILLLVSLLFSAQLLYAGGRNDLVKFPANYKTDFTQYDTRNRVGKPQVVDLYANQNAQKAVNGSELADDSIIVMEVYKAVIDDNGEVVVDHYGLYEKGKFAAIAVMEKRSDWGNAYPASERAGDWGFAIYTSDGKPKDNDLDCAGCHQPLSDTGYLFSFSKLTEPVK